jgi:1-deoxy-D-xylulose-5-phosphate reductoisomerase
MKNLSILGSTGSIGCNVLKIVELFPERFAVKALAAKRNISLLSGQIERFHPEIAVVYDASTAVDLQNMLPPGAGVEVLYGEDGYKTAAAYPSVDMVVVSFVGASGLMPTLAAIEAGKNIALANKETLVMAGRLIMAEIKKQQVRLLPIDSEHSAIAQALEAGRKEDVARIILTASGGPFLHLAEENLWQVTPEKALDHPNWDMGRKISVDSATLMNKGLEVIEAHWLFDIALEKIEVLVHPQSIVHSLVEFIDGSVVAQLGIPDMRVPISYALSYPERLDTGLSRLNLTECSNLSFLKPDTNRFPALQIAYEACKTGGCMPTVLNAANEIAVEAFLEGKLKFPEISKVVRETLAHTKYMDDTDIETILDVDRLARIESAEVVRLMTKHAVRAD